MKLIIFFILIISCSTLNISDYPKTIPQIQKCWEERSIGCVEKHFGSPAKRTEDFFVFSQANDQTLKVFVKNQKIVSIYYWIMNPNYSKASDIKALLSSDDWKVEKIPETNPHVVNLAEANFSKKLGSSFLTYKLDPEKMVRIIYWGADYKKMEF